MRTISLFLLATVPLTLQACSKPQPVVVHEQMLQITASAQKIWDSTNNALDDEGNPSAAKMTAADWDKLIAGADGLKTAVTAMADGKAFMVRKDGKKIQDEELANAPQPAAIQKNIDANPDGFRKEALILSQFADEIGKAAAARNLSVAYAKSAELDGKCEECHKQFWFPTSK